MRKSLGKAKDLKLLCSKCILQIACHIILGN